MAQGVLDGTAERSPAEPKMRHPPIFRVTRGHGPTRPSASARMRVQTSTAGDGRRRPRAGTLPLTGLPVAKERRANSEGGKMAQDERFDLARLERLERRLQTLEDAEAIRNLKARYAALCDAQYDADGIAMLFTEDALWESPSLGRFEGREAIRGFFRGAPEIFSFAIHYSLNGHSEVDGDTAQARWY